MDDVLQKSADGYEPRGRLDPAGFRSRVQFQTFVPDTDLLPFVEHFWSIRWEAGAAYQSREVMHRPYVDVFVSADWSGVQGTFRGRRTYTAEGSGRILGARLRPGAFHAFWRGRIEALEDRVLLLDDVFPGASEAVHDWLRQEDAGVVDALAGLLRSRNPQPDDNIDFVNEIIAAMERDESLNTVGAVARAFDRSERWLQQLFQDYVGMGTKWLIQRQRLLKAARQIREIEAPAWADLAYSLGYSSQQHFNTDFKKVVGQTPVEYKKSLARE